MMTDSATLLFSQTQPAADTLYYQRHDPGDPRLGERVQRDRTPEALARADVVLLGCPQDEGVRRNQGRVGAAEAPAAIRQALYRLTPNSIENLTLYDLGDTIIADTLEATHDRHQQLVQALIRAGKRIITLGGGNDLAYPDCAALALELPPVLAFNIDAHFDVRADTPRNSGTPYRQLLEQDLIAPGNFYEMGYQPFAASPVYLAYLREQGVQAYSLETLGDAGITRHFTSILDQTEVAAVFWGFDVDVVTAADAPGVSAPNPTGMHGRDFWTLARLAGREPRTRLIEFTEMNPRYDVDGRTARLVAVAIYYYLTGVAQVKRGEQDKKG